MMKIFHPVRFARENARTGSAAAPRAAGFTAPLLSAG
jgi:hypothetical protein